MRSANTFFVYRIILESFNYFFSTVKDESKMNLSKKYELFIFFAIAVIAAGLRLYHLGYNSLWMDEIYQVSLQTKAKNLGEVINFASYQNQPPLDYIIGYLVLKYVPFSEFTVRFPPFLFGSGTVLVSFFFVRRFFNLWTAVLSSFLLSFSTILIYFSQEARPYSIFFFFLMILLTYFFGILESGAEKSSQWLIFIFIAFLTLITRGMAPVTTLIALNSAFGLSLLISFVEEKRFVKPLTPQVFRNLIISTIVSSLFFLPFFLKVWRQSQHYVNENPVIGNIEWTFFEPIQLLLTSRLPHNLESFTFFCLIGFILGAFYIIRQRKINPGRFLFLFFSILEPIISVYLYYIVVDTSVLKPKSNYFVQSIIPIFIISSYGYFAFINYLTEKIIFINRAVLFSIPLVVIFVQPVLQLPGYYEKPKADYRGAVNYLRSIYKNEDVAVYDTFRSFGAWEPYLYGKGVYFGEDLDVRQYDWNKWISLLEEGFETEGRLFLFLHAGKANGPNFTHNNALIERNFEQMTVIYAKDNSLSLKETSLLYIDELLDIFPDNSSKVDLYLAKARLICKSSGEEARENIKMANNLLLHTKIDYECK